MRPPAVMAVLVVLLLCVGGCGSGSNDSSSATESAAQTEPNSTTTGEQTTVPANGSGSLDLRALKKSLDAELPGFLARADTTLAHSIDRTVGAKAKLSLLPRSVACLPGAKTPAIKDTHRYPFACIATATASGGGFTIQVRLGLVVIGVKGLCWRASNERIEAAGSQPVLIPREQALAPENVVSGCAHT
jgi:hypothetical protein